MVLVAAVVEGADGRVVTLYDVNGRMLATKQDNDVLLRFEVPASGQKDCSGKMKSKKQEYKKTNWTDTESI